MSKLNLITRDTVKTQLGIAVSTYDSDIDAQLPIVSSDIRRILNNNYSKEVLAAFSNGSDQLDLASGAINANPLAQTPPFYPLGQVFYAPGLPDDIYTTSFDPITGIYTMSSNATADGSYVFPTLLISQWPAVSQMIWYKIQLNVQTDSKAKNVESERFGPVSIKYANSEINKKWNYPQKLINDLGTPFARIA